MISARMLTSIYESRTGSFSAIARSVMISAEVTYGDAGAATDSFSAIARSVMISAKITGPLKLEHYEFQCYSS